jgi:hypothetical protein
MSCAIEFVERNAVPLTADGISQPSALLQFVSAARSIRDARIWYLQAAKTSAYLQATPTYQPPPRPPSRELARFQGRVASIIAGLPPCAYLSDGGAFVGTVNYTA